jgi:membrane-bound lytic murein transglycosylase D
VVAAARDVPDPEVEIYGSSRRGRLVTHVVRRGESLGLIAKRYHTSVAALMRLNHLRKSVIIPGQEILVRRAAVQRPRASASRGGKRGRSSAAGSASARQPHVAERGGR